MNTSKPSPPTFLDERTALACVHCGLCLSSCPTYLETGNENDSPRGRIYLMRALQDGRGELSDATVRHIDLCLGCRACETACPSGVRYGELLEGTRDHIEHTHQRPAFQRFLRRVAIEKILPYPWRMKLALLPAMLVRGLGMEGLLPKFAREALALVPEDWDSGDSPDFKQQVAAPKGEVGFVTGCVMSVLFSQTNANSVRLLNRAGFHATMPRGQRCCGALHAHSGQLEQARKLARQNIDAFAAEGLEAIVINAAGCGSALKDYGHLLKDDPAYAAKAAAFSAKVKDLTEFLSEQAAKVPEVLHPAGKVTYHDACHLAHAQRVTRQPRDLVRSQAGASFVPLPEADLCCGSAGTYNLTEPEMAARLQQRKVKNILATGARTVVTSNPGCILQIRAGLKAAGANHVQVVHIADYLSPDSKA